MPDGRYRTPDPFLHVRKKFVFRRVAANSTKIELGADAGGKLHLNLLQAMGFEIASIHAAGSAIKALKADLGNARRAGSTPPRRLQPRLSSAIIGSGETDADASNRSAISIIGHFEAILAEKGRQP